MIWVLTGAITLSIIVLFVYLFSVRPRARERYGVVVLPAEDEIVELPAGEVGVYYQDSRRWNSAHRPEVDSSFSLLISDPEGNRVDLAEPGSEIIYKAGGKNRIPYGRLELPRAGSYNVTGQINEGVIKPAVTFGEAP